MYVYSIFVALSYAILLNCAITNHLVRPVRSFQPFCLKISVAIFRSLIESPGDQTTDVIADDLGPWVTFEGQFKGKR